MIWRLYLYCIAKEEGRPSALGVIFSDRKR
jgi:hypothetical protein